VDLHALLAFDGLGLPLPDDFLVRRRHLDDRGVARV
jgi:hypothetical protein